MGSHRRPIRRSIVIRASVFLLLIGGGAIVNVAVAWGACLASPRAGDFGVETPSADDLDHLLQATGLNLEVVRGRGCGSLCKRNLGVSYITVVYGSGIGHEDWEIRSGIPFRCLWGVRCTCSQFGYDVSSNLLPVTRSSGEPIDLPLRPIWPGFAINTLFYAAILWALFAVPAALRRKRRGKRGLCVKCGYDLRGSTADAPACPECGTERA